MKHVMIDLETFGVTPQAPFVSIGACTFNPDTGNIGERFYRRIDWNSAMEGRKIDPDTLSWWFNQSQAARDAINLPGEKMINVLEALALWLPKDCQPWGNGSTFDISMLEDGYRQCGLVVPWKFWHVRDVRTIVEVGKLVFNHKDLPFEGVEHNALHDAIHQAKYVSLIWQGLRNKDKAVH